MGQNKGEDYSLVRIFLSWPKAAAPMLKIAQDAAIAKGARTKAIRKSMCLFLVVKNDDKQSFSILY
jgi:hypothetical protein